MARPQAPWYGQDAEHGHIYDAAKQSIDIDGYELMWDLVPIGWPRDGKSFYGADGLMLFQSGVGYIIGGYDEDLNEIQIEKKDKKDKKHKKKHTAALVSPERTNQAPQDQPARKRITSSDAQGLDAREARGKKIKKRKTKKGGKKHIAASVSHERPPHDQSTKKPLTTSDNEQLDVQEARGKAIMIKAYPNVENTYKAHFEIYNRPTSYHLPLEHKSLCKYLRLCWIKTCVPSTCAVTVKGLSQQVLRDAYDEAKRYGMTCTATPTFRAWERHPDSTPTLIVDYGDPSACQALARKLRNEHWFTHGVNPKSFQMTGSARRVYQEMGLKWLRDQKRKERKDREREAKERKDAAEMEMDLAN